MKSRTSQATAMRKGRETIRGAKAGAVIRNKPATPLDWRMDEKNGILNIYSNRSGGGIVPDILFERDGYSEPERDEIRQDMAHIAHAVNAYPKLIAALREARNRLWQYSSHSVPEFDSLLSELGEE